MGKMNRTVVVAGMIVKSGRLLIAQRPAGKHMAGKWEFPGGKIEKGETPEQALERELREELDIDVRAGRIYHAVAHSYPEKDILLLFYRCRLLSGEPRPVEEADVRWIEADELDSFDWAEADVPVIRLLMEEGFARLCDS